MQFTLILDIAALIFNCLGNFAYSTKPVERFFFGETSTDFNDSAKVAHVLYFEQMCPADDGQAIDVNTIPAFALT